MGNSNPHSIHRENRIVPINNNNNKKKKQPQRPKYTHGSFTNSMIYK